MLRDFRTNVDLYKRINIFLSYCYRRLINVRKLMIRKFIFMAILTLIFGLSLLMSPAFNERVYAEDGETVATLEIATIYYIYRILVI